MESTHALWCRLCCYIKDGWFMWEWKKNCTESSSIFLKVFTWESMKIFLAWFLTGLTQFSTKDIKICFALAITIEWFNILWSTRRFVTRWSVYHFHTNYKIQIEKFSNLNYVLFMVHYAQNFWDSVFHRKTDNNMKII